jgi:hypothetical protein
MGAADCWVETGLGNHSAACDEVAGFEESALVFEEGFGAPAGNATWSGRRSRPGSMVRAAGQKQRRWTAAQRQTAVVALGTTATLHATTTGVAC